MNGECLDIGVIQAFLDREISPEESVKVSGHIADCDACAGLLAQADEENSQAFSVLDRELDVLVPTMRLWSRINNTIAVEKSQTPIWKKAGAFISGAILSPSFAAASGLILVAGLTFIVWNSRTDSLVAVVEPGVAATQNVPVQPKDLVDPAASKPITVTPTTATSEPQVRETNFSAREIKQRVIPADYRVSGRESVRPIPASQVYLPGEESFIKTIDTLQQGARVQNASMDASSQVAFQRDLAVVDNSIKRMRDVVQKDPKNQAARQVLYSSYQDKIELLKSSAQRGELMASLQ